MDLRQEILKEHSKRQALKIERWVNGDQKKFDELVKLFLKGEYRVTQRAGWPMSSIAIKYPELIHKHLKNLLLNAQRPGLHNAVLRNTVRLLQFVDIPPPLHGLAAETCFQLFKDKKQPIAIRVFSMTVLGNLCKEYPEMISELKLCIEEQLPYASAGFLARAKKVIREIDKVNH
jgi:hypothetical protein